MQILKIPFALSPAAKPIQTDFVVFRGVFRAQLIQNMDVLPDFPFRHAQQTLNVRADVIHFGGLCVQHQEDVVHVQRELLEQLVPVQDLGVLPAQRIVVLAQEEQDDRRCKAEGDACHDLHRPEPELVQIGIDDLDRDKAQHRPALDGCALVDQIITGVTQLYFHVSAAALLKRIREGKDLLLRKVGVVAQHRDKVVDRFCGVYRIVDDHPPVRVDHIVAGAPLKSRIVQRFQHSIVIVRDGDGIVVEVPVAALYFGTDEHEHLGFAGQYRIHDDILAIGELFVQIGLQAEVARFARHGHIVSVVGKKVKVGKSGVLLCLLDIRLNFAFV